MLGNILSTIIQVQYHDDGAVHIQTSVQAHTLLYYELWFIAFIMIDLVACQTVIQHIDLFHCKLPDTHIVCLPNILVLCPALTFGAASLSPHLEPPPIKKRRRRQLILLRRAWTCLIRVCKCSIPFTISQLIVWLIPLIFRFHKYLGISVSFW